MVSSATGSSSLDAPVIKALPKGDGNLNELLKWLPDVQLSDQANSSAAAGEILPADISISGGKPYANNFMIDGLGSNNLMDPANDAITGPDNIPGTSQGLYLNAALIDRITVYQSNIPARFGGFTGGVVAVKTKEPGPNFSGHFFLKTTRDAWSSFHIDSTQEEAFKQSADYHQQPRFEKYQTGLTLNIPVTDAMGFLVAYHLDYSTIPIYYFGNLRDQSRRLDNLLIKGHLQLSGNDSLSLSATSTPYKADYFLKNVMGSAFRIKKSGNTLNASYHHNWQGGTLDLKGGYSTIEESRQAPSPFEIWKVTPSKDWGDLVNSSLSEEGGYGDLRRSQKDSQFAADLSLLPKRIGELSQAFASGFVIDHTQAKFVRPQTAMLYYNATADSTVVCGDDPACVDHEQYFKNRYLYSAGSAGASLNQYAVYAEDHIRLRRLELRPGVRVSYDDLMENFNVAPRLAGSYDVWGNGVTVLIAGLNRYYGAPLLTYKLDEAIQPTILQTRNSQSDPWETSLIHNSVSHFSQLKTPSSDELTAGLDQALAGGRLRLRYVQRYGKDEFAKTPLSDVQPDGLRYYTLNNNGRSEHQSVQVSWERQWNRQYLQINGTWQKTTSSNLNYADYLSVEELNTLVWYHGSAIAMSDLPGTDYNHHYLANLIYTVQLPWGLRFTNATHYRSGYDDIESTGKNITLADGEQLDIYDDVKEPASILFDWTLGWEYALDARRSLALTLTILNVFDRQVHLGNASDEYELGRQFWAGLDFSF